MELIQRLARDARFALRSLRRTPAVTAGAVLSIAMGIAAATAAFSVVDAALFRRPPFDQPGQLAALFIVRQPLNGPSERRRWSWSRFRLLQRWASPFESVGSFSQSVLAITGDDAEPVDAEAVSSSYLVTLRVRPLVGRNFDPGDDEPSTARAVALIGFDLWQRRFGGDRAALGRTVEVNGVPLTVIGVLPSGFRGLTGRAQLWIPPTMPGRLSYGEYQTTNQNFISVVGRLKPAMTMARATAAMSVLGTAVDRALPSRASASGDRFSATARSLADARVDPSTRTPMLVLLAAATCLLALACANVAGLLLGRAVSRQREIAIRVAIGASRARIVAQLFVEATLLAMAGGGLGILAAIPVASRLTLPSAAWRGRNFYGALGEFAAPGIDWRVLAFAVAISVLVVLLFGLVPAVQSTRVRLTAALKDGSAGGGTGGGRPGFRVRRMIVAGETALAIVLLITGGALAASWRRLATTDTGFDDRRVLTFLIRPSETVYPPSKAPALIQRVLATIEDLPEVEAASVDGCAPVSTGCASSTLYVEGRPAPRPEDAPPVLRHYVGPDHFRTLRIPILRGHVFDERDRAGANRVAVINELAARRFWPNEDPIGQRVWFGGGSNFDRPDSSAEIIGIVGNVAYQALDEHPFQPDFYTPYAQFTYASRTVLVRTRGDPLAVVPALRRALHDVDPTLAMFDVRRMDDVIGDSWSRIVYQTKAATSFALVALFIAGMGIFAVIAHAITDRRREIGIRAALGATSARLFAAVAAHGAQPAAAGLIAGLVIAVGVTRLLSSFVYGVRWVDPIVLGAVAGLVSVVVGLSSALAARRALAIEPVEALKAE